MEQKDMFKIITGQSSVRTYKEPDCFELSGQSFQVALKGLGVCELSVQLHTLCFAGKETDYTCVKCEDSAYLLGFDGKILFLNAVSGEAVLADGDKLYMSGEAGENPLVNWETNMTFAAFHTLMCKFGTDSVTIGEDTFAARYVELADSLHFVQAATPEGCMVLLLDTARFLMVGGLNGKLDMGGYIEIPPQKRS